MELLTRVEAEELMMKLRHRQSTLCKLKEVRQREWYGQHPQVESLIFRLEQLEDEQDKLGFGCMESNISEEKLIAEMHHICDELSRLPKCPDGLTLEEEQELRNVMSQAQRLRIGLSGTRRATDSK